MADLFNLECKLLDRYEVPYFCSRFMVIESGWMYFVPDIVKLITKFGRRDMANYEHVEKYRVSTLDVLPMLDNELIVSKLSVGLVERYGGQIVDCSKVLRVLVSLISDERKFSGMFVVAEGSILCCDPSVSEV